MSQIFSLDMIYRVLIPKRNREYPQNQFSKHIKARTPEASSFKDCDVPGFLARGKTASKDMKNIRKIVF